MAYKFVKLSFPIKKSLVEISVSKIFLKGTIYDIVDFFRDEIFLKRKFKKTLRKIKNDILLSSIINLHDEEGVDFDKIKKMFRQIKSGRDVLSGCGLPNVKLVKTKNNEWVLFDGHHSLLAYMKAGRKYLSQIPCLVIDNEGSDNEINVFFGKHAAELKNKNWRNYVINWKVKKKQLCKRKRNNLGEVFNGLSF